MSTKYFCAHCDKEFFLEEAAEHPRCPRCMRKGGVEPVKQLGAQTDRANRPWLLIAALVIGVAGIGYGVYRSTRVTLEQTPPLRPLEPRELSAYLARDQIQVGPYAPMMMLPDDVEGWPASPLDIAGRMRGESSSWSLEQPLQREVLTAGQTLATMDAHEERVKFYPLELATAMTALLRQRGVTAMVAEVWEFEGERAPADPSGMLGYFVTAVYDEKGSEEPSAYFDPWGGRGKVKVASARVLRDTEVLAAALGTEAARILTRSGDGVKALPMVETALQLDPRSPSLRDVNAAILVQSGGLPEAVKEFEAALQLRPDGPRQLNLVQLQLAQAGMMEMAGQDAEAQSLFSEGERVVAEVIEKWPRYARAHLVSATIHLGLHEPERARVELEAAQKLSPDAPMLWAIWSQYHLAKSDPAAAAVNMKRAVDLDADNWQLRVQAARLFHATGDEEAASANAAAALQLVPPDKRADIRQFIERAAGPDVLGNTPGASGGPALMLGDPSHLHLSDPGQTLKLDLDK